MALTYRCILYRAGYVILLVILFMVPAQALDLQSLLGFSHKTVETVNNGVIVTFSPESHEIQKGQTAKVSLSISDLPAGLNQFDLLLRIEQPGVVRIKSVTYADWVGLYSTSIQSPGVRIKGADMGHRISAGARAVPLATFELSGEGAGTTDISLGSGTVKEDGDLGASFTPGSDRFTIKVIEPAPIPVITRENTPPAVLPTVDLNDTESPGAGTSPEESVTPAQEQPAGEGPVSSEYILIPDGTGSPEPPVDETPTPSETQTSPPTPEVTPEEPAQSDVVPTGTTIIPTTVPTPLPTTVPTTIPTTVPTPLPTTVPTSIPTTVPTPIPTTVPTSIPTTVPTPIPTTVPTSIPATVLPSREQVSATEQPVLTIPPVTLTLAQTTIPRTVIPTTEGDQGSSGINAPASQPGAFMVQPGQVPVNAPDSPVATQAPVVILTRTQVTEPTNPTQGSIYLIPSLPAAPAIRTPEPQEGVSSAPTVSHTPAVPPDTPVIPPVPAVTYFPIPQSGGDIHADFTAIPVKGTPPLTVQFTDLSTGPVAESKWDFGDGTHSGDRSPAHTYGARGTYTVRLTVKSSTASSTALKDEYIIVADQVGASFIYEQQKKTYPYRVQFTDSSKGDPVTFEWDFGDGVLSSEKNPAHSYVHTGVYPVVLTVSNPLGRDSIQQTVRVVAEQPPVIIPDAPQVAVTEQKLVLVPGWNLIAIPFGTRSGSNLAVALDKVDTDSHSLWKVNRTSKIYERIMPDTVLEPLEAVWVYSRGETTVTTGPGNVTRVEAISLKNGWNALGYPLQEPRPAREALSTIEGKWSHILGYAPGLQAYETAIIRGGSGEFSDSRELEPGRGYLVFMTEDGLLTLFG